VQRSQNQHDPERDDAQRRQPDASSSQSAPPSSMPRGAGRVQAVRQTIIAAQNGSHDGE
jgi:hypothetical protein